MRVAGSVAALKAAVDDPAVETIVLNASLYSLGGSLALNRSV